MILSLFLLFWVCFTGFTLSVIINGHFNLLMSLYSLFCLLVMTIMFLPKFILVPVEHKNLIMIYIGIGLLICYLRNWYKYSDEQINELNSFGHKYKGQNISTCFYAVLFMPINLLIIIIKFIFKIKPRKIKIKENSIIDLFK
jgi:hypothetical protein